MELSQSDLSKFLQSKPSFSSRLAIARDVAKGLKQMHGFGMTHRDIKPANILISKKGTAKLGDLGLARFKPTSPFSLLSFVGTRDYAAPEIIEGKKYDQSVDLYSLGRMMQKNLFSYPELEKNSKLAKLILSLNSEKPSERQTAAKAFKILSDLLSSPQQQKQSPPKAADKKPVDGKSPAKDQQKPVVAPKSPVAKDVKSSPAKVDKSPPKDQKPAPPKGDQAAKSPKPKK